MTANFEIRYILYAILKFILGFRNRPGFRPNGKITVVSFYAL